MNFKLIFPTLAFLFLAALSTEAQAVDPVLSEKILALVDQRLNMETDMTATFAMTRYRVGEKPDAQELKLFFRPKSSRSEIMMTALVLKPDVDKGTGYLRNGDNFWIYDPESRAFSHSSARESVQDSDVNNDDLGVSNYVEDYGVTTISEGVLGKIPVYLVDLKAKKKSVAYEHIKLWVSKEDFLPYKEEDYSVTGTLMRTVLAPKWSKINGKYIYRQVYFIDELKVGNKTVVNLDDINLSGIPDHVFTKAYLERVNN